MMNFSLTRWIVRFKRWAWDSRVEARAKAMLDAHMRNEEKALSSVYEEAAERVREKMAALKIQEDDVDDRRRIAEAWRPFEPKHNLTKNHERALVGMTETNIEAITWIIADLQRDLSNRALVTEGSQRDKAMWVALGTKLALDAVLQRKANAEARHVAAEKKDQQEAKKKIEEATPRTVANLYDGIFPVK